MKGKEIPFEDKLWKAADKLRNNIDAAEYKHVILGLIFLKYFADSFNAADKGSYQSIPKEARWEYLQKNSKKPTIGKLVNKAMESIEKHNPSLKDMLPKGYDRPRLDKHSLGELIDLIGTIAMGDSESRSKDILGRVYEYLLGQFAEAEGKKGGQFYTPRCIVKLLVEMIEPYQGKVFDPCCGSGGMFVQSDKFVKAHGGKKEDIYIYGQESNHTTWRLCVMNLAIRGIDASIQWNSEGSFIKDAHKNLKADFILANPPFNDSDWKGEKLSEDPRWIWGIPPQSNANFAWVQHFIYHLAATGIVGFVLSNGSLSSNNSNEAKIRKNLIEGNLIDCIVSLPNKLFYNTQISACLWFIAKDKKNHKFRNRKDEVLFIDARSLGKMTTKKNRVLTDEEIKKVANTYHGWRNKSAKYKDVQGFCKSASISEIARHKYVLVPGRYTGCPTLKLKPLSPAELDKLKQITENRLVQINKFERNSLSLVRPLE